MNGRIRIIGGQWKRRWLTVVDVPGLRPTSDRVRETLFNWLGQDLTGQSCLDMFSGTGALGFEAASRGAARVVMLEQHPKVVQQLRYHRAMLAAHDVAIVMADAMTYVEKLPAHNFDLIFLDPPFTQSLHLLALKIVRRLLREHGVIYIECPASICLSDWSVIRYGKTRHTHYYLLKMEE